jgi:hypothetical protein
MIILIFAGSRMSMIRRELPRSSLRDLHAGVPLNHELQHLAFPCAQAFQRTGAPIARHLRPVDRRELTAEVLVPELGE